MAEKKETEKKTLNVYQKLLAVRNEFLKAGAKKTGKNLHAEFMYFELKDIVPIAELLFEQYGLLMISTFRDGSATAMVFDVDKPSDFLCFDIPLMFLAEPGKFRMNEIQGVGSAVTYYRRYLYMIVLDLVDADAFDGEDGKKNLLPEAEPPKEEPKKFVSAEERAEIKEEIIDNAKATEEQIGNLKALFKDLLDKDPDQEDFVSEVFVKTDNLKDLTQDQYSNLVAGITEILTAYEG